MNIASILGKLALNYRKAFFYHTDNQPYNFFSRPLQIPAVGETHRSISRRAKMLAALLIIFGIISRSRNEITGQKKLGDSVPLIRNC